LQVYNGNALTKTTKKEQDTGT